MWAYRSLTYHGSSAHGPSHHMSYKEGGKECFHLDLYQFLCLDEILR
jgi:hypothetical protein